MQLLKRPVSVSVTKRFYSNYNFFVRQQKLDKVRHEETRWYERVNYKMDLSKVLNTTRQKMFVFYGPRVPPPHSTADWRGEKRKCCEQFIILIGYFFCSLRHPFSLYGVLIYHERSGAFRICFVVAAFW